jgi:hypothetical protein
VISYLVILTHQLELNIQILNVTSSQVITDMHFSIFTGLLQWCGGCLHTSCLKTATKEEVWGNTNPEIMMAVRTTDNNKIFLLFPVL